MSTDEERRKLRGELGSQLKMLRERTRMTQEDLAALIGVHSVTLRYWEIGKSLPLASSLQMLVEALARKGAWKKEREIHEIWDKAREAGLKATLDEEWLKELRGMNLFPAPEPPTSQDMPGNREDLLTNTNTRIDEPPASKATLQTAANNSLALSHDGIHPQKGDLSLQSQDRQRMLDQIDSIWIKGLLEESLKNVTKVELELHEQPHVVEPPWKQYQYLQAGQRYREELVSRLHIVDAYKSAHHKLLILGEPGSGKTTLLLQLCQFLLTLARSDSSQPMPVIFSLASWAKKHQPIEAWLVEELCTKYHLRPVLSKQWIEQDQILPLFDGLDEVDTLYYSSCIEALNIYLQEHGLVPTVICTRRSEYLSQPQRLLLQNAILVQPLTEMQIDACMQNIQKQQAEIRTLFIQDSLLRTPLMLRMLTSAYEDGKVETTDSGNALDFQQQVFTEYILQMFKRRPSDSHYNPQQTIHYLQWLARQLQQHKQKDFYIEFMQFDWLPDYPLRRQLYPAFAVALIYGLLSSLGFSISYLPLFPFSHVILFFVFIALFNTLLYGFFNGIVFGVLADNNKKEEQISPDQKHHSEIRQKVIGIMGNRAVYGILNGLLDGIFVGLIVNPVSGWICGLFSCVFCATLGTLDTQIKCAEHLKWSLPDMWQNAYKFLVSGWLVGLLYGLVTGRDYLFVPTKLLPSLILGSGIGLLVGLLMSIRGGFIHKEPDTNKILTPNQGLRNSIRNSLFFGSFFGIAFGLLFGLIYGPVLFLILGPEYRSSFPANSGLIYGLSDGMLVGAFFWLVSGGIASIQHALLRLLLWKRGSIPWNYARFLNRAVDLALLHKLGGGYIFFHGLLQEYFATVDDDQMETLLKRIPPHS
jgi:transcriptional regulator with XRE-family HTH domain